jgi:hypothetical protein
VKSGFYQDRISTGREGGTSDDRIALSRAMSGDGAMVRTLRNVMKAYTRAQTYYHQRINVLPRELVRSRENGIDFTG